MPKIDITKSYQTCYGQKVRLISDQGSEEYPIIGYINHETIPTVWTADGRYYKGKHKTEHDLVPLPQTIQTLPYRRFVRKCDEGYYVAIAVQDPSHTNQIKHVEAICGFIQWLDTEWITTSFELLPSSN